MGLIYGDYFHTQPSEFFKYMCMTSTGMLWATLGHTAALGFMGYLALACIVL